MEKSVLKISLKWSTIKVHHCKWCTCTKLTKWLQVCKSLSFDSFPFPRFIIFKSCIRPITELFRSTRPYTISDQNWNIGNWFFNWIVCCVTVINGGNLQCRHTELWNTYIVFLFIYLFILICLICLFCSTSFYFLVFWN